MGDVSGSNCRNTVKNTSAKMIQIPIRLKKFLFNFQAPSPLLITLFSGCKFQTVKDTDNSLSWKCFLFFLTRIFSAFLYVLGHHVNFSRCIPASFRLTGQNGLKVLFECLDILRETAALEYFGHKDSVIFEVLQTKLKS